MKKLFGSMSLYGLGGVLAKVINFILLPIYTRVLEPADYGVLELTYMAGSLMAIFCGLMVSSGFLRNYYDSQDEEYRKSLFSSAFWFILASGLLLLALFFVFADQIAGALFDFSEGAEFLKLIGVSTTFTACATLFYNLLMVQEKPAQFVTFNFLSLSLTLGLTVFFVVFARLSVRGVLYAQIIGRAVDLLVLFLYLLRASIFRFSFFLLAEMLRYSVPLLPLQLAAFILNLSNRFFLQEFLTLDDIGVYALGYRFASVLLLFAVEPWRGFTPYLLSLVDDAVKCKKTLADFSRYYVFGIMVAVLSIGMFCREVVIVMSSSGYYSVWNIVYWLALAYGIYGLIVLSSLAIEVVKKNWISSAFWIVGAVVNVALNLLLIPLFGVVGASLATLLSYLIILLGYWAAIKAVYPVPYNYGKFLGVFGLGSLIYVLSTFIQFDVLLSLVLKIFLLALFVAVPLWMGYLTRDEMDWLKSLFILMRRFLSRKA